MSDTFRGAILLDQVVNHFGTVLSSGSIRYTKPYSKKNVASGQATRLASQYPKGRVLDKWVEQATEWTRV